VVWLLFSKRSNLLIDLLERQTLERSDLLLLLKILKELTLATLSSAILSGISLCHLGFDDIADKVKHALFFGHAFGTLGDEGLTSALLDFLIQSNGDLIERLQAKIPEVLKAEVTFGGDKAPLLTSGFDYECF
jgi:hypothetical protein